MVAAENGEKRKMFQRGRSAQPSNRPDYTALIEIVRRSTSFHWPLLSLAIACALSQVEEQWSSLRYSCSLGKWQQHRKRRCVPHMQVISLGLSAAAVWWAVGMLKNAQNPISSSQRAAKKRLCNLLRIAPSQLQLDEYEYQHLSKVMLPQHIAVTLPDVAGSDEIVAHLREEIAFSCSVSPTSANSLLSGSKGLLLYGPPGTGKTMIASVRFSGITSP
jgi:hypothetical protein